MFIACGLPFDEAGRVLIPAALRERAGLTRGAELEITQDELDVAALVEDERSRWR
jgi:bifunctional DNA-binding transcriptional regulator/antitoxin component of YhaV-PrlF toxin-antitoxin module